MSGGHPSTGANYTGLICSPWSPACVRSGIYPCTMLRMVPLPI
jgi:hypothetical protein